MIANVIDSGCTFSTYDELALSMFGNEVFLRKWKRGFSPSSSNLKGWTVVGKRRHGNFGCGGQYNDTYVYGLIKGDNICLVGNEGVEIVEDNSFGVE